MVPILCKRYNLPSLSTEAELKCDHKYWSRQEQANVIPEHTPAYAVFHPFDDDALSKIEMPFPFWIKPVKGTGSLLAYVIHNRNEFNRGIKTIRENIGYIAKSFNQLMAHASLPEDISKIDGYHCIAEEVLQGHQCTVEGHAYNSELFSHGIVDSTNYPNSSSFFRYQYPSQLNDDIRQRIINTSLKLIRHLGFENVGYNIEYFYDKDEDNFKLLEINPRISQSHCDMFYKVDGESNHELMVELALGHEPDFHTAKSNMVAP